MPESNHGLGLNQIDVNKNIRQIFTRRACCNSSTVKDCNRCWHSLSANFDKIINYILSRTAYMQIKYNNKFRNCFSLLSNRLYFNPAFCSIGKKWMWCVTAQCGCMRHIKLRFKETFFTNPKFNRLHLLIKSGPPIAWMTKCPQRLLAWLFPKFLM